MEALHFTTESIAGLMIEGILMILIPVVLLIIWQKRTHENILPVVVGGATWFVFAILLKLAPAYFLLQANNPIAKAVSGNAWLSYLVAGILAGVFEETGRFLAYKFVLKKYEKRRASISYGIGHGGFESVYVGFQMGAMAVLGVLINAGFGDFLTVGADEATVATLVAQLSPMTDLSMGECLLAVFERLPAIAFHISASVLVFAAVREKKYAFLFPLAIILHFLFDFSIAFYAAGLISAWAMEFGFAVIVAPIVYFAYRIYKKLGETAEAEPTDKTEQ
ncbi:MAG: YhfC family intramembrane metalloprotease [Clostridia bacterium]|nr:YhfC family intramembrane metalloprotease [Clostridia bacterium]